MLKPVVTILRSGNRLVVEPTTDRIRQILYPKLTFKTLAMLYGRERRMRGKSQEMDRVEAFVEEKTDAKPGNGNAAALRDDGILDSDGAVAEDVIGGEIGDGETGAAGALDEGLDADGVVGAGIGFDADGFELERSEAVGVPRDGGPVVVVAVRSAPEVEARAAGGGSVCAGRALRPTPKPPTSLCRG